MILHAFAHHGTHAFPESIAVDFDALPALIAVHGPNGAGKTTVFDAITAALYLVMPFRPGALHRNFVKKGEIVLRWSVGGECWESVIRVDPDAERTEATLVAYTPQFRQNLGVIAGPLVKDYKRAVEAILGPLDTFLASAYAVQSGAGAFLRMPRADRKALLTDLLGLGVFPRRHDAAKARLAIAETEHAQLTTRIETLVSRAAGKPALIEKSESLRARADAAEAERAAATGTLDLARVASESARLARAELEPVRKQLAAVEAEIETLKARITETEARKGSWSTLLSRTQEVAAAVARDRALRVELEELDATIEAARQVHQTAVQAANEAQHARQRVEAHLTLTERTEGTLTRQTAILGTVPCRGEGEYAACQFLKDARAASDQLPAVTAEVAAARLALGTVPTLMVVEDPTTPLLKSRGIKVQERLALASVVTLGGDLDVARARVEELERTLEQDTAVLMVKYGEQDDLTVRLKAIPALDDAVRAAQQAENAASRRRDDAQKTVQWMTHELGQIEGQLQAILAAETEAEDLGTKVAPLVEDLADWTLLAKALGPAGIPALLIDAALPEISRLATDLLTACFGEQVFTITLTTQRENAAGDKLLETLDVVVTRGGEPLDAALLSGGESVLVSEALSLAIALYSATRSGRRVQTLLRDEVSAPLDVDRAPAYVRMLRQAAKLGSFRHVLFVSHQPACLDLADAQLEVRGGKVVVR